MTTGSRRADEVLARLPGGSIELARSHLTRANQVLTDHAGLAVASSASGRSAAAAHLVGPLLVVDDWPEPSQPLPAGGGAVHADLSNDDHEQLARLRCLLGRVEAETVALEAQHWRLAVTPYRTRPGDGSRYRVPPAGPMARPSTRATPPDRFLVVDLTSLWAGPLATGLLARQGARVVKLDPSARPDALADHPAFHHLLNEGKEVVDLDLRTGQGRSRFEDLVADADLVIDSFSRRVMPNFGYGPDQLAALAAERGNRALATMSIVAFPVGCPERDWISYGPGVHAAVGLGDQAGDGPASTEHAAGDDTVHRWRGAPIAYPDALAGLAAFATAVSVLYDPARLGGLAPGGHHEISLAGAIAPLLDHRQGGS